MHDSSRGTSPTHYLHPEHAAYGERDDAMSSAMSQSVDVNMGQNKDVRKSIQQAKMKKKQLHQMFSTSRIPEDCQHMLQKKEIAKIGKKIYRSVE